MKTFRNLVLALIALALTLPGIALAEDAETPGQAAFAAHKCTMCHGVAAANLEAKTKSERMKGPDLSGYTTDLDFATLAAYLRKAQELEGEDHKKEFKGTDEELQAIVTWLGSLEAQE